MRRETWDTLPDEVEQVRERFARWRQTRRGRSRIPQDLWAAAAGLARRHGVHPVARALGLSDHMLRMRMTAPASAATEPPAPGAPPPAFVELAWLAPSAAPSSPGCCRIELRHPGGAAMTITLEGAGGGPGPDLAALVRAFWNGPA